MRMEQYIRAIAGTFILASLALGWWVSPWFFLFTAFVGANLLQSAFTGWCLMEDILSAAGIAKKAGVQSGDRDKATASTADQAGTHRTV